MCIGGLITGLYLAPKWKATGNLTAAEFIRERLGEKVQKTYIYIFMLVSLFMKGSVLYSVSKLVASSLGFPLIPATIVLGIIYDRLHGCWWFVGRNGDRYFAVCYHSLLPFLSLFPWHLTQVVAQRTFCKKRPERFFNVVNGEYAWGFIPCLCVSYHIFYNGGNWTFVQRLYE